MGVITKGARRLGIVAATTAAFTLAGASVASAHHCYKDEWQAAAYEQLSTSRTAWMTLSDLGAQFIIIEGMGAPECAYVADDVVQAWMADMGMEQEPIIHARATVGGGAFYHKGKAPGPFEYLGDEDFMVLEEGIVGGVMECQGGGA